MVALLCECRRVDCGAWGGFPLGPLATRLSTSAAAGVGAGAHYQPQLGRLGVVSGPGSGFSAA